MEKKIAERLLALCCWILPGLTPVTGQTARPTNTEFTQSTIQQPNSPSIQQATNSVTPFHVRHWTTDDRLPQNRIACLKQTRDGYLWIGTWYGLVRFDGQSFAVFNKLNTPEFANAAINSLVEDERGTLWIATRDGLVSYSEHQFHRLTISDGLPDTNVWMLARAASGGLWLQAGHFISHLRESQFSHTFELDLPNTERVLFLDERERGRLNVVTDHRWLAFDRNVNQLRTEYTANPRAIWLAAVIPKTTTSPNGLLEHPEPASMPSDAKSATQRERVLVGNYTGLWALRRGVLEIANATQGQSNVVDFLFEDRSGGLWMNVAGAGLHHRSDQDWQLIDLGPDLAKASIICMEQDLEGSYWVGTSHGLVQLRPQCVRTYTTQHGLPDNEALSVCQASDGTIWAGTGRGLGRIGATQAKSFSSEPWPNQADRCLWPNSRGGVWVAKDLFGVCEFQNESFAKRVLPDVVPGRANVLYGDSSGRLWVGVESNLLVFHETADPGLELDGSQLASIATAGLSNVHCVLEGQRGEFWFGAKGTGLWKLQDRKFHHFTEQQGLSNNDVWSLHEDGEGTLWVGTDNGLTRCRGGELFAFKPEQGLLLENNVNCVLEDHDGYLWLSGLLGCIVQSSRSSMRSPTAMPGR